MTALAVGSWLKKEGESKQAVWIAKDTVGMLYRTQTGESGVARIFRMVQLRRGKPVNQNFGIKSFYPKIGGHVFTPKFRRRARELVGFQSYANQGVDGVKVDICWIECDTGSILFEWRQHMTMMGYDWRQKRYISDSTKGERLESKLS